MDTNIQISTNILINEDIVITKEKIRSMLLNALK